MPARTLEGPVAPPPSSSGLEPPRASGSPALYAAGQVLDAFSGFGPLPDGLQPAFENFRPYSERSPSQLVATMNSSFCRPMFRAFAARPRPSARPAAALARRCRRVSPRNSSGAQSARVTGTASSASLPSRYATNASVHCARDLCVVPNLLKYGKISGRRNFLHPDPGTENRESSTPRTPFSQLSPQAAPRPLRVCRTVSGERYRANGNRQKTERRRRPPPR